MNLRIYVNACGIFTDHVTVDEVAGLEEKEGELGDEARMLGMFVRAWPRIPGWAELVGHKCGGEVYGIKQE